jgi:hypothetical protein
MGSSSVLMRTHRPVVVELLNRAGWLLEKTGLLRLRAGESALMDAARRRTGLADFGDDSFREPLGRLLHSLKCEARLNLMGKLAARQEILQLLINRLQLRRDRGAWPGIPAQTISRPLFIIGLPRSGTTLLHGLLAQDPQNRSPLTWEVMYPSPPDATNVKQRIAGAEKNLAWLDRLAPGFKAIHLAGAELPQECVAIMSHAFMSDEFDTLFNVPSYRSWLESADMRPAYACHREFLQHLQFRLPARRWVLKAPAHMLSLGALFDTYPDALIVQTHREPLDVIPSTASLMVVLRSVFSDHVDPAIIGGEVSRFWAEMLGTYMSLRDNHPAGQFFDLNYDEIVQDPLGAVRRLYLHFGDELTPEAEQRMRDFLARNPKDKHGPHRYTMAQFGLDPAEESPRFDLYRAHFHLAAPRAVAA